MSTITAELLPAQDVTYGRSPLAHFASDVWVLTARTIAELLTQIIKRGRGRLRRPGHRLAGAHRRGDELAVVCWSVAMLVVFAPLAVRLYRRKALG